MNLKNLKNNQIQNIESAIFNPKLAKRIVITPLIDIDQIKSGAVDLRLGTDFILTRKTSFSNLDPIDSQLPDRIKDYQEKISIKFKENLVLHPNQFILGCTLEYIKLPSNVMGYIIGRSSWGRIGLIIATATLVNPGFAGVITLELTNVGDVPLYLYPGLRIAQITLHECNFKSKKITKKKSKYFGSTRPNYTLIYEDEDLNLFRKKR